MIFVGTSANEFGEVDPFGGAWKDFSFVAQVFIDVGTNCLWGVLCCTEPAVWFTQIMVHIASEHTRGQVMKFR